MTSGLRQAIFFFLLVGVAAAGYQYMIKPANQHLAEAKRRVEGKRAKLADFEEATAQAEDFNKQVEQLQEAVRFFESKLPPTSEVRVLDRSQSLPEAGPPRPSDPATKDNNGYVEQPSDEARRQFHVLLFVLLSWCPAS
jgi:hypothetical protein